MVQLMPLPPRHLLLQQNPEWFILLVLAYPSCPGKKAIKWLCVCVCALNIYRVELPPNGCFLNKYHSYHCFLFRDITMGMIIDQVL